MSSESQQEDKKEQVISQELEGIRTANESLKPEDPVGLDIPVIKHSPVRACEDARPVLPDQKEKRGLWSDSRQTAVRSAFFFLLASIIIYFILMNNHMKLKVSNPVDNTRLENLKIEVGKNIRTIEDTEDKHLKNDLREENKILIEEIRELDHALRIKYFTLLDQKDPGIWILFFCLVGFFLSLRGVWKYSGDPPLPVPDFEKGLDQAREKRMGGNGMLFVTGIITISCVGVVMHLTQDPVNTWKDVAKDKVTVDDTIVFDEATFDKNWPWFRGTVSTTAYEGFKTFSFGDDAEKTIKWKAQIPMTGISSPIIWDRRVFITGANSTKRALYCYNADTGKLSWSLGVRGLAKKEKPETFEDYMFAAISPATDGHRVYAAFSNGDMVATDLKGTLLWEKDLGLPENAYGMSSSLLIYKNQVIVPWEHEGETSSILCLDGKTGKEIWKIDRHEFTANWRSPIIIKDSGKDLLVVSHEVIMAFDLSNGKEVWRVQGVDDEIGTSPVYHEGMLYTLGDDGAMLAIKLGGTGDITKTHVTWLNDEVALPDIPSPVTDGKRVWTLGSGGDLVCHDAKDGKMIYEAELEMPVYATPILLGDVIVIFGQKGRCITVGTGDKLEILSDVDYKLPINATAAPYGNRLIQRAAKLLFCIEGKS